ncbi:MAG: right-handed parallel beta-helix repeat-containing protein [Xanthomonadales bacterium]|nr:right-handed parallel beta-helix repeat-containing protein [Xanthomonadales bacterium]
MKGAACNLLLPRRRFLRQTALLGLPLWFSGGVVPVLRAFASPADPVAGVVINVRTKGAAGDGHRDDTAPIQASIDALPLEGGTVLVPGGTYLIDTDRPLRLREGMHLELASDAVLAAKPSTRNRFYVLLLDGVSDVEISGGRIRGERNRHQGTTGEWGYGIFVRGADRVHIHDIKVSECWGDGICIGGVSGKGIETRYSTGVTLARVACTGNRRQGLTIGPARHVSVVDSEFSDTAGTRPACGIDIEPDRPDTAQDIQIRNCVMRGNQGSGIQIYRNVSQVTLQDCTIRGNAGYGVLVAGARQALLTQNTISDNGLTGAMLRGGADDCQVQGNAFANNATRTLKRLLDGARQASLKGVGGNTRDVQVMADTQSITVSGNTFSG